MVGIRCIGLISLLIWSCCLQAQDFDRTGLLKASLTIAPGISVTEGNTNIYLHGFLEYYPESKVSLRGNGYYFIASGDPQDRVFMNHTLSFGCLYHPLEGKLDPFFGVEPSLLFVKIRDNRMTFAAEPPVSGVLPGMSLTAGCNYFISPYFNFFVSGGYMLAARFQETYEPVSVSDIRISAGLGFALPVK